MPERRRMYERRGIKTVTEHFVAEMCCDAGVPYRGIQSGFGIQPDVVLFDDAYGSTLCLPVEGLTVEKIMAKVDESNQRWMQGKQGFVSTVERKENE